MLRTVYRIHRVTTTASYYFPYASGYHGGTATNYTRNNPNLYAPVFGSINIHLVGVPTPHTEKRLLRIIICSKVELSAPPSMSEVILKATPRFHDLTAVTPCDTNRLLHYHRYLRWAELIGDSRGVSHANMCLARVYDFLRDGEAASRHKKASLEGCRRVGDIDNHGKVRTHSTFFSGVVVTLHLKNRIHPSYDVQQYPHHLPGAPHYLFRRMYTYFRAL